MGQSKQCEMCRINPASKNQELCNKCSDSLIYPEPARRWAEIQKNKGKEYIATPPKEDKAKQLGATLVISLGIAGLLVDGWGGAFWGACLGMVMTIIVLAIQDSF